MATDLFFVISDPTRRNLLQELGAGERSVGELVDAVGVSQPTVSKHLKVLRDAGLAHTRVQGQKRFYTLIPEPLGEVVDWLHLLVPSQEQPVGSEEEAPTEPAQRRNHTVGRTMEQVSERAQEFFDRLAKPRFGRKGK